MSACLSACAVLWVASLFRVFLRPVGSITSAYLGRQELLVRCQGFLHYVFMAVGTTVGAAVPSRVGLRLLRLGLPRPLGAPPSSPPTVSALQRLLPLPGPVGGFPLATMLHLKDLRTYVDYASRTITCSGVGGRIPADDNGALRDVAVVSVLGRLVQRSAQRQWLRAWSTEWHWPWRVGQSRDQEGLMAVKERKRVFGHVHVSGILGASAGLRGGRAAVFPLLRILPCVSFFFLRSCCAVAQERK